MKMATKTTNYGLEKPDGTDFYDVDVQNSNMDIIDKQMKANANAITQLNSEIAGSKQCGASYQGSYFYPETFSSSGNKIGKIFVFWARIKNSLEMPANWYNLCNFVDKPVTEITGWCPCNIFVDGTDPRDVSCVYHNEYGLRIVVPNGCTIPKDSWININGCLLLK